MALINKVNFTRFSRFGVNLGRLTYTTATHEEATDGTDELKITCDEDLTKGERLVWLDRQGVAHEHIVDEIERLHDADGKPYTSVTCINSINETWDDYIEDKRPSGSAAVALASILAGTRWEVGNCDQPGGASHTFYHISVREGLSDLLKTWGGELETVIETDGVQVTHRYVRVVATRGNQQSPKRFTWTKDLISIKRKTGSANPKTRVYGYGKGVETDGGGYGRRLTFGDINGGKDYVEDASATEVWGHPDGSGGIAPAVDVYINEQCEDAAQLLAETRDYLETVKAPTVSYEASVLDLFAFGRDWEGVAVGDCVAIIDKGFSDAGIRLKGRVSKLSRDLVTGDASVTFGNLTDDLADIFQAMTQQLKSGSNQRANYDAAAGTSVSWLNQLMAALNKAFNAVGTYKVETFELGVIYSNVPLDAETGVPLKATSGMWAVNINGMGIRLAASLTSDGQWNWRTFITGAQVSADCINAGTMRADRIRAGLLTDEKGKNFWSLTSGYFQTKYGSIGGLAIGDTKIYSGKLTLNSNTYGLYIGRDGFSVGSGSCYTALSDGYLYGGSAEDITGYVGFNNTNTATKVKGTRLAGKGCICLMTDDWIGVCGYKPFTDDVTCTTGKTGSITLVGNLRSSWTNLQLTGTYNVSGICQNLSMNWTNYTLTFDHGLMVTSL